MSVLSEPDRLELWKLHRFTEMGFSGDEIACLLFWGTSPHDVEALFWRNGKRTRCTHEQAMGIVKPLEVVPGRTVAKSSCVNCEGEGCEFCPRHTV